MIHTLCAIFVAIAVLSTIMFIITFVQFKRLKAQTLLFSDTVPERKESDSDYTFKKKCVFKFQDDLIKNSTIRFVGNTMYMEVSKQK